MVAAERFFGSPWGCLIFTTLFAHIYAALGAFVVHEQRLRNC